MKNVSMTGSGIAVFSIIMLLNLFGIVPEQDQVAQVVNAAILFGSWIVTIWGQVRRKDLKMGMIHKD